jgi:hypothetical protein
MYTMMANIEGTINEARKSSSNDSADEQVNLQTRASNVNNNDDGSPVDDDDGFLDNQNSYEPARNRTTNQSESVRRRNNERPRDIQHRNVEQLEHQAEEEEESTLSTSFLMNFYVSTYLNCSDSKRWCQVGSW